MLYGHMDKQPPLHGQWLPGTAPHEPVMIDGKLYGRGGADDGYSCYSALTAIMNLQKQNIPHSKCVVLIEACEESGSRDLPYYVDALASEIGIPTLVICLDSGAGNYDQLWLTSSLRGLYMGVLKVKILNEGVHSGSASGIVPSTFRIVRQLLDRIEDVNSGEIKVKALNVEIPAQDSEFASQVASILGTEVYDKFPFVEGGQPVHKDGKELLLNMTWRPTLCVTGCSGMPGLVEAGNVLRTETAIKLSIRMPPTAIPSKVNEEITSILTANPPYGAQVEFNMEKAAKGWTAPALSPWLVESLEKASQAYYGKSFVCMGEGGSIPFMGMLGEKFPQTQFVITGVLGPHSNAHGPNEFLHVDYAIKITNCISNVLQDH